MNRVMYTEEKHVATPFLTVLNRCKANLYAALNPKLGCSIYKPKYESMILSTNSNPKYESLILSIRILTLMRVFINVAAGLAARFSFVYTSFIPDCNIRATIIHILWRLLNISILRLEWDNRRIEFH